MSKHVWIVSAAMLMEDGLIVPGVRHYSLEMRKVLRRIYGTGWRIFGIWIKKPYSHRVKEQGFIDNFGNFLSREEALKIALTNGQRRFRCGGDEVELYSENLY